MLSEYNIRPLILHRLIVIPPVYVFDGKPPALKSGELANRKARKAQAIADYEKAREAGDVEMMQKMADRTATVRWNWND